MSPVVEIVDVLQRYKIVRRVRPSSLSWCCRRSACPRSRSNVWQCQFHRLTWSPRLSTDASWSRSVSVATCPFRMRFPLHLVFGRCHGRGVHFGQDVSSGDANFRRSFRFAITALYMAELEEQWRARTATAETFFNCPVLAADERTARTLSPSPQ